MSEEIDAVPDPLPMSRTKRRRAVAVRQKWHYAHGKRAGISTSVCVARRRTSSNPRRRTPTSSASGADGGSPALGQDTQSCSASARRKRRLTAGPGAPRVRAAFPCGPADRQVAAHRFSFGRKRGRVLPVPPSSGTAQNAAWRTTAFCQRSAFACATSD